MERFKNLLIKYPDTKAENIDAVTARLLADWCDKTDDIDALVAVAELLTCGDIVDGGAFSESERNRADDEAN